MRRRQTGMTLVSFILVLAVAGVFIYMGMKLIPMYSEYMSVKKAVEAAGNDPDLAGKGPEEIRAAFFKRLEIDYVDSVKKENVVVTRKDAGYLLAVDYEVRRPLIANLDVVGHFHADKEVGRAE